MSTIALIPSETRSRGVSVILGATVVYVALHFAGFHRLLAEDAEGIGVLLQIIGTLYSVMWGLRPAKPDENRPQPSNTPQ